MDFNDIEYQIKLNEERLNDESERHNEIRSRIGFISIVYTLFAAYGFQLVQFTIKDHTVGLFYDISLFIFLILVLLSIIHSVRLIIPARIAYRDLPSYFYQNIKDQYIQNGIHKIEIDAYIKQTYKIQLEEAVKTNFEINNRKSKFHYYAFVLTLLAIIPYLTCIGIYLSKEQSDTVKVELTNEIFNDMSKYNNINNNQQPKQAVDSSKVILKKPVLIRENQSKERGQKAINK